MVQGSGGGNGNTGNAFQDSTTTNNSAVSQRTVRRSPSPAQTSTEEKVDTQVVGQVYSDKKYWTQFHKDHPHEYFEWFCHYDDIKDVLKRFIPNQNAKILEIGCGLSALAI